MAPEAEQNIVDSAQDLPKDRPIEIVVHLQSSGHEQSDASGDITRAIAACFTAREKSESNAIHQSFRDARLAFLIGIPVLAACLLLAWRLSLYIEGSLGRVAQESFVIIGWVVIWRPVEMCLYDWLPLVRRRKLFRRLAASVVTVKQALSSPASAASG